ncbi:hypothetical protein JOD52_001730 [Brachybacterium muris]|uniref:hypothetical protein n=1 Tax=Brachybacterium muris TaxID=219301 RepID=UPI001956D92B|nr:hypothetical protein [Brachybacterium muris]MBM7500890.1 hypothetical protein [Brachybacterium muris]
MNPWSAIALLVWLVTIVVSFAARRSSWRRSSLHLLVLGTGIAVLLSVVPSALAATGSGALGTFHAVIVSIYYSLQTFTSGADVPALLTRFRQGADVLEQIEAIAIGMMHLSAPLLLITVIVSYFQAPVSIIRFAIPFWRDATFFSELTDRSIALAESLRSQELRTSIVFGNVAIAAESPSPELIAKARAIGAVCFAQDLLSAPLPWRLRRATFRIFIIGDDDVKNAWYGREVVESRRFGRRDSTDIYVFSAAVEAKLALGQRHPEWTAHMRLVNPARAMVYDWLWRSPEEHLTAGTHLFRGVTPETPTISAAVIGLGEHGTEMLRAMSWFCRMELPSGERVRLHVDAFDIDPRARDRVAVALPGLLPENDALCLLNETTIEVHESTDATTAKLVQTLHSKHLDFVFVALGDDTRNIAVAIELFRAAVRSGSAPQILAVSRNSATVDAALGDLSREAADRVGDAPLPSIHLVGDTREVYRYDAVVQPEMELNGLVCHLAWADLMGSGFGDAVESFWLSEYNYSSSIAVPIHWRAKRAIGAPGARVVFDERSPEQHLRLQRLEHDRWCSFMLSEGFVPGQFKNAYLIRTHPLLVPFEELSESELSKDDNDALDTLRRLETNPDWQAARSSVRYGSLVSRMESAVRDATAKVPTEAPWVSFHG